jgi:hypothetical protein
MRAFAEALDAIPMTLAENSGLSPIETLASLKSRQVKEKNSRFGVDCMQTGSDGMFFSFFSFVTNVLLPETPHFTPNGHLRQFPGPPRLISNIQCQITLDIGDILRWEGLFIKLCLSVLQYR